MVELGSGNGLLGDLPRTKKRVNWKAKISQKKEVQRSVSAYVPRVIRVDDILSLVQVVKVDIEKVCTPRLVIYPRMGLVVTQGGTT